MKTGEAGGSLLMSAVNACRARLRAFIRGRTPVRDDADDILQEITYQLMKVEQPVENVAAWLLRAARNEMTDRARKSVKYHSPVISVSQARRMTIFRKMRSLKPCSAFRIPRKRSTSKRCCGKSWGRRWLNCPQRSARSLRRRSYRATASNCWPGKPGLASRHYYRVSIRPCCSCARDCGMCMTR